MWGIRIGLPPLRVRPNNNLYHPTADFGDNADALMWQVPKTSQRDALPLVA
jgi:hypothetical protein